VHWEKASVAIERNGTIALGMEWSNIRLLIAWAELCRNCKPCKVAFVEWEVAGVAEWNIAWGLCSVVNEPLLLWGAEVGKMNGSVM